jgi:hypothetical protein
MVSIPSTKENAQVNEQESATLINLNYGFFQCPEEVLKIKGLSWRAKCIYERLLCYARQKEVCFPGHARLAVDLGKSVDTIQRGLRELKDFGLITWRRRGLTKTNIYTIVKLSDVPALKNDPSLKPHVCGIKKPQNCGILKPQNCGTNQIESNNTQVEPDEASSNSLGGMVEAIQTDCHIASGTIRNTQENTRENTEGKGNVSNVSTAPTHCTNPSPPNRADNRTSEPPQTRVMPRRRPLASNDEVTRKPEPPRMTAPPFTQEDMDSRIRERIARERTKQENPLDDIIRPSHQETLNRQFGGGAPITSCKSRRQPVYEKLQVAIERISEELGDFKHVTSNITQAENIRRETQVDIEQFIVLLYEARTATKYAVTTGKLQKQDSTGKLVKMPYFFAVLRQRAGISKGQGKI